MRLAILPRYQDLQKENSVWNERHYVLREYEKMARENGVGLWAVLTPIDMEGICEHCDGLVIPGSRNRVNPSYYGGEPMDPPPAYDDFATDIKLIDYFVKHNKPIFGICAGLQAINIYFGGTIGIIAENNPHSNTRHDISITPGSFVYDVFKSERADINSYHTRHIVKLGEGLTVVAKADDGVIEAVENKEKRIFATQWHPEQSYHADPSVEKKFFENFLECCRKKG